MIHTVSVQDLWSKNKTSILGVFGLVAIGGAIFAISWAESEMEGILGSFEAIHEKMPVKELQGSDDVQSIMTITESPKFNIYDYLGYSGLLP